MTWTQGSSRATMIRGLRLSSKTQVAAALRNVNWNLRGKTRQKRSSNSDTGDFPIQIYLSQHLTIVLKKVRAATPLTKSRTITIVTKTTKKAVLRMESLQQVVASSVCSAQVLMTSLNVSTEELIRGICSTRTWEINLPRMLALTTGKAMKTEACSLVRWDNQGSNHVRRDTMTGG